MRRWWLAYLAVLPGCSFIQKLPEGPVQTAWERTQGWAEVTASGVVYQDAPQVAYPVLPMLAWGAAYDLDIVVVSQHPRWDMHEYARLSTPRGPVWLVKEARAETLEQVLVTPFAEIGSWMPELPMQRRAGPVGVVDRSTGNHVDIELQYTNFDGEEARVHYRGDAPVERMKLRNGSTMGHSRGQVMAVLDLPDRGFGRAEMEIAGRSVGVKRILGLVPFAMTLIQTQAGFTIGRFQQEGEASAFRSRHLAPDGTSPEAAWDVVSRGDVTVVRTESEIRSLNYEFIGPPDALELARIVTTQWGRSTPTSVVEFSPAIPDLRRRFEGVVRSRYAFDVNGQDNHAVGWVEARWTPEGPRVRLIPERPWWTADRPMETRIQYDNGRTVTEIVRIER
jgi:hypothetical protein